jgi:hypothetical protein
VTRGRDVIIGLIEYDLGLKVNMSSERVDQQNFFKFFVLQSAHAMLNDT